MLQGIVRGLLLMLFTWMIAKGWVTQAQVDSNLPTIVNVVLLLVTFFGAQAWAYFEKLQKGHITVTGQTVNLAPPDSIGAHPENLSIPRQSTPSAVDIIDK